MFVVSISVSDTVLHAKHQLINQLITRFNGVTQLTILLHVLTLSATYDHLLLLHFLKLNSQLILHQIAAHDKIRIHVIWCK